MKKVFLLFIIYFIFISGCEYFTLMSKKEWEEKAGKKDDVIIYVGGWYDTAGLGIDIKPCYWKIKDNNIELIDLESNTYPMCIVYSIGLYGKDVYTCGYIQPGALAIPCYWVNKKRYDLKIDTSQSYYAYSMKVLSGVVFISGTNNTTARAFFSIDQLVSDTNIQTGRSIFIQNTSSGKYRVFVGGQNLKTDSQACYWKDDDSIVDLPPFPASGDSSEVNSIYVIGNTVYSVGTKIIGAIQESCLWKNTELIVLPGGEIANSVFLSDEDVYAAGVYNFGNDACYWKNKNFHPLSIGSAESIYVYNDNAYIAGSSNGKACYWINSKQKILDTPFNSGAFSIIVTSDNEN